MINSLRITHQVDSIDEIIRGIEMSGAREGGMIRVFGRYHGHALTFALTVILGSALMTLRSAMQDGLDRSPSNGTLRLDGDICCQYYLVA